MADHNLPYLIIACSVGMATLLVAYTRDDMARGVRRIREWFRL